MAKSNSKNQHIKSGGTDSEQAPRNFFGKNTMVFHIKLNSYCFP